MLANNGSEGCKHPRFAFFGCMPTFPTSHPTRRSHRSKEDGKDGCIGERYTGVTNIDQCRELTILLIFGRPTLVLRLSAHLREYISTLRDCSDS
jgi:hypothetical protein